MHILFWTIIFGFQFCLNIAIDEIECYSCRHELYDGVPQGDENCEILTGGW